MVASYESPEAVRAARNFDETSCIEWLVEHTRPDDVFWDIGAHHGYYSCLLGQEAATVVAFEPFPPNQEIIDVNFHRNQLENAQLNKIALSDNDEKSRLTIDKDSQFNATPSVMDSQDSGLKIQTRRADSLIKDDVPKPTIAKIDVEGAEMQVLKGFGDYLEDISLHTIFCEAHGEFGVDEIDIADILEDAGFTVESLGERGPNSFIGATR